MPRVVADMTKRTITLDTQRRKVDVPVDATGHVRRAHGGDLGVRAAGDDGAIGFKGHAAVFGQRTWIGSKRWGFWEVIENGSFAKTIREKRAENNDVIFNRDHDNKLILARSSNGTLRLSEDDIGLAVDADMGDYTYARDIETALTRRDVTGMSFAFDMITYEWSIADDGEDLLTLRELELFDVAVVGMPAYAQTDASLRMDLLAVCRNGGLDDAAIGALAERLADPDPELLSGLRALALRPPEPAAATRDDSPPVLTTGKPSSTTRELALATLARATVERSI